jgi:hypothetical protein
MWKRVVGYGALLAAAPATIGTRFTYCSEKVNLVPIFGSLQ